MDKTVSCECNCKYVGESSYPLQVTDEYSFAVEDLIRRTLCLFQEGHTSRGKCNSLSVRLSQLSFTLVAVRENEPCPYLFHTFITPLRAQQEENLWAAVAGWPGDKDKMIWSKTGLEQNAKLACHRLCGGSHRGNPQSLAI